MGLTPIRSPTRLSNAARSSALKALSSDSIGNRCSTDENPASGAAPTRWVGESSVFNAGYASSRVRSRTIARSYSASGTLGASFWWYSSPQRCSFSRSDLISSAAVMVGSAVPLLRDAALEFTYLLSHMIDALPSHRAPGFVEHIATKVSGDSFGRFVHVVESL